MSDPVAGRIRAIDSSSRRGINLCGPGVVSLASGDPANLVPAEVVEAMVAATHDARFAYAHPQGTQALREAIAAEWAASGVDAVTPEHLVVTHGATGAIASTCMALLEPGDRVLLPTPTYSLYADAVRLAGAEPVALACGAPFSLPLDALAEQLPGTKALFLCNPSNPTGTYFGPQELLALAELVERAGTIVVVDEAYSSIVYPPADFVSAATIAPLRDHLVLLQTYSKRFCLTGLRLGYLWAPPSLVSPILRAHRTLAGPINVAGQHAVTRLLGQPRPWEAELLDRYVARRALVDRSVGSLEGAAYQSPAATFFAFFRPTPLQPGDAHVEGLLRNGVALRPGEEFGPGGEGYVRLSFCGDLGELELGLERIVGSFGGEMAGSAPNRHDSKETHR